ncbi:MAG: type II secretion system protein [Phycisphaerales bacterium]|nr:type II secretion system protein [Phycisphaerales bacterium]
MHILKQSRQAITLAETVVSILLISFVLVSTLQIVGPISRSSSLQADRLVAANLANELAEEIATKLYVDDNATDPDDIGIDADDTVSNRTAFDDIDDYNEWTSSPPMMSFGTSNTSLTGWTRSVKVRHVLTNDPSTSSPTDTGLKKVVIRVRKDGVLLADIRSLHSHAADNLGFVLTSQTNGQQIQPDN